MISLLKFWGVTYVASKFILGLMVTCKSSTTKSFTTFRARLHLKRYEFHFGDCYYKGVKLKIFFPRN